MAGVFGSSLGGAGRDVSRALSLDRLARAIEAIEWRERGRGASKCGASHKRVGAKVAFDEPAPGAAHEWFIDAEGFTARRGDTSEMANAPPLSILTHIAAQAMRARATEGRRRILWIGRRCWPWPVALARHRDAGADLLEASIFVEPSSRAERVWTIDCALRSRGVAVVVADSAGLKMPESRRLQLAAAAGGTIGLLARPHQDRTELSAAQTRWIVTPAHAPGSDPRWIVELLRCKGMRPAPEDARRWIVQLNHETVDVHLVGHASDRSDSKAGSAASVKRRIA